MRIGFLFSTNEFAHPYTVGTATTMPTIAPRAPSAASQRLRTKSKMRLPSFSLGPVCPFDPYRYRHCSSEGTYSARAETTSETRMQEGLFGIFSTVNLAVGPPPKRMTGSVASLRFTLCPPAGGVWSFQRSAPPSYSPRRACARSCSGRCRRPARRALRPACHAQATAGAAGEAMAQRVQLPVCSSPQLFGA
jgi:hypothetical protein